MRYGILFSLIGAALVAAAVATGGWGWLLLWPALSSLVLAAGYLGAGARVLGKRPDGSINPLALLLLLPFTLYARIQWWLLRAVRQGDVWNEVAPGLLVGRRVFPPELPPEVRSVVDLTAEFAEPLEVRRGREYRCLPTLDGAAPPGDAFPRFVEEVIQLPEPVYVHCAEGRGRSGTLAAAILLRRGTAKGVDEAIATLRRGRPVINPSPAQRRLLAAYLGSLEAERRTSG